MKCYELPTLPAGETVDAANVFFEISGARQHTGSLPDLDVYLLDTANPDGTGTGFFFHGASDGSADVEFISRTSVPVSGTGQNNFADDAQDRTFPLTGDALALFKSFYGGDNTPDQTEAFFRFNMSQDPALNPLIRYNIDLNLSPDESGVAISSHGVSGPVIPEPMTMLAVGLGITSLGGYIRKRRRG